MISLHISDNPETPTSTSTISSPSDLSPSPLPTPLPSPTPAPLTLQQPNPPSPDSDSSTMVEIPLFKGTDRRKENPQNWLQTLESSNFKYDTSDLQRIYTFSKHLEYGSKADIWFKALGPVERDMWDHLEAAFQTKWHTPTP